MKVFIVGGAGAVGSAAASAIARRSDADEIVLYDLQYDRALSQAMDLGQSLFLSSDVKISAARDWSGAADADLILIAAGLSAEKATHDAARDICAMRPLILSVAEGMKQYCPEAVVLSMTNPLDAFNCMLYQASGLKREQFIALSVNDSLRFRWAIGTYLGVWPAEVDALVIGEHGPGKLPLFSTVKVNGEKREFTPEEQAAVLEEMDTFWQQFLDVSGERTAAWTTGESAAITIAHLSGALEGPVCCSVIMEEGLSIGYPVYLNRKGVVRQADLSLTAQEEEAFRERMQAAKRSIAEVRRFWDTAMAQEEVL